MLANQAIQNIDTTLTAESGVAATVASLISIVTTGLNAGNISCKNSGTLYAQINAGIGQTQMSIFTVPNNYVLLVYSVSATTNIHYTSTVDYIYSEYNKQNLASTLNLNGYQTVFNPGSVTKIGRAHV